MPLISGAAVPPPKSVPPLLWLLAVITMAAGGTPASQAICFVLKNMLGLTCDPVAGLVEVPYKRTMSKFCSLAADMAFGG